MSLRLRLGVRPSLDSKFEEVDARARMPKAAQVFQQQPQISGGRRSLAGRTRLDDERLEFCQRPGDRGPNHLVF